MVDDHPGRVLLAFPSSGRDISTRFLRSYVELDVWDRERAVMVWESIGAPEEPTPIDLRLLHNYVAIESSANIAKARNRLVDEFLTNHTECDWLWFVDTDMVFDPDTMHRMVARAVQWDVKILGALCVIITADGPIPTLFIDDPATVTQVMLDWPEGTVQQVAATGTGCLLIHRSVLEQMQADAGGSRNAWFGFDVLTSETGTEWALGEDVSFCLRARRSGFDIYVDTTCHVGHHKGTKTWWPTETKTNPAVIPPEQAHKVADDNLRDVG
jgi:hypothetical protein